MQTQLLIDGIVRQTTVLIAQLATSGGLRAPLAHVAAQVFVNLARELEAQGVSRKVSADMFGVALRTYQRKTQRLRESASVRGRSLWEAVLEFIQGEDLVTRGRVQQRFRHDDQTLVRGVLRDLTDSGFVFASGSGASTAYRAARPEDLAKLSGDDHGALDALVWGVVYREGPVTRGDIAAAVGVPAEALGEALARLVDQGRAEASGEGDARSYRSRELFIPIDASAGWEAAVFDHFQALVRTICQKLERQGEVEGDRVGGSTYSFAVWPGHPHEAEVLETLARFRAEQSALRARVESHNQAVGIPGHAVRIVTYAGQSFLGPDDDEDEEERA